MIILDFFYIFSIWFLGTEVEYVNSLLLAEIFIGFTVFTLMSMLSYLIFETKAYLSAILKGIVITVVFMAFFNAFHVFLPPSMFFSDFIVHFVFPRHFWFNLSYFFILAFIVFNNIRLSYQLHRQKKEKSVLTYLTFFFYKMILFAITITITIQFFLIPDEEKGYAIGNPSVYIKTVSTAIILIFVLLDYAAKRKIKRLNRR